MYDDQDFFPQEPMNLAYYTDDGEWDKPSVPLTDEEHIEFFCLRGRFYER